MMKMSWNLLQFYCTVHLLILRAAFTTLFFLPVCISFFIEINYLDNGDIYLSPGLHSLSKHLGAPDDIDHTDISGTAVSPLHYTRQQVMEKLGDTIKSVTCNNNTCGLITGLFDDFFS
jgi:hypothetical protein